MEQIIERIEEALEVLIPFWMGIILMRILVSIAL